MDTRSQGISVCGSPYTVGEGASADDVGAGKGKQRGRFIFRGGIWRKKSLSPSSGAQVKGGCKKGRGKRPGSAGDICKVAELDEGTANALGVDVGGGWVLYTDAEGHQYFWNEALQESR